MLRKIASKFRGALLVPVAVTSAGVNTTPKNISVSTSRTSTGKYTVAVDKKGGWETIEAIATSTKGTGNHIVQIGDTSKNDIDFETRTMSAGSLSNAAFDALLLASDFPGHKYGGSMSEAKVLGKNHFVFFKIDGTNGELDFGTVWDGSLTKNGTGDYTINLRFPSWQVPHVFVMAADYTQYAQVISKTTTSVNVGLYDSSGSAADGAVYVLVLTNYSVSSAWGNHVLPAKSSHGGVILMPFRFTPGVTEVKSSLTNGSTNSQNVFTSKLDGTEGDDVSVELINPGTTSSLAITVTGTDISVTLAYATGAITTTAAQLKSAIEGNASANALVSVTNGVGNGTGLKAALTKTNLSGGVDAEAAALTKGAEYLSIERNGAGDWSLETRIPYSLAPFAFMHASNKNTSVARYGIHSSTTSGLRIKSSQDLETAGFLFCFDKRY